MPKQDKGFTLIELLIIIGIIGFLAAAILVAVDPVRRIQESRDSRRWSEVNSILNAYLTKQVDDRDSYWGDVIFDHVGATVDGAIVVPSDDDVVQVIVSDTTGVDCSGTPNVACGDLTLEDDGPGYGAYAYSGADLSCVADLASGATDRSLAPEYIAELPLDPTGQGHDFTPGVADLTIDDSNTGYYIHRSISGRVTIGACWPERPDVVIKVMR